MQKGIRVNAIMVVVNMDIVEQLAIDRAKALFGADYANVQPHSGSQANAAVYMALAEPGDTIFRNELGSWWSLNSRCGGEFFR